MAQIKVMGLEILAPCFVGKDNVGMENKNTRTMNGVTCEAVKNFLTGINCDILAQYVIDGIDSESFIAIPESDYDTSAEIRDAVKKLMCGDWEVIIHNGYGKKCFKWVMALERCYRRKYNYEYNLVVDYRDY